LATFGFVRPFKALQILLDRELFTSLRVNTEVLKMYDTCDVMQCDCDIGIQIVML